MSAHQDKPALLRPRRLLDAVCGLLAAGSALAAAELLAALINPAAAPLLAVGATVVDLVPPWLKDFAVETFGTADKPLLLGGMAVVLALFAALIGVLARARPWAGDAGVALFAAVGAAASLTRPAGGLADALPAVLGALVGIGVLRLLLRACRPAEPAAESGVQDGGFDRRRFVLLAGATAGLSAAGGASGRLLAVRGVDVEALRATVRLPRPASPAPPLADGVELEMAGLDPFFTPNSNFYRIDTALSVPRVDATTWRLRVHGRGVTEREYSYADLLERDDLIERDVTLACVSNPVGGDYIGNARWIGVPLAALLREAGVRPPGEGGPADQIVSRSVDGMTIGTPVQDVMDGRDAMLALGMNGAPLPLRHGFPVRMVVPGLYGYVSACKWLAELELTTFDAFDAYWVPRGWSARGPIKTQSRIDRPQSFSEIPSTEFVVAGVAWAQHTGIDRVEVRLDGEQWREDELAAEDTADTWRQWSLRMSAEPGEHRVEVRATDRSGTVQTEASAPVAPDGATGWHSVSVTIT